MSSKYTRTHTLSMSEKMSFMKRWKAAGALVKPNGITHHSKEPYQVRKVVFHSLPSRIWTRWYACFKSIFVYTEAFRGLSSRSEIHRSGYRSFFMILLRLRKSVQSRREPSFFWVKRTGVQ